MTAVSAAPAAMLPRSTAAAPAAATEGILADAVAALAILSVARTPRSLAVACGRGPWDVRCRHNLLHKIQRHLGVDMAVWVDRTQPALIVGSFLSMVLFSPHTSRIPSRTVAGARLFLSWNFCLFRYLYFNSTSQFDFQLAPIENFQLEFKLYRNMNQRHFVYTI
jgi:hypothetical protein